MGKNTVIYFLITALSFFLQGCFTGIESTPKIKYNETRQESELKATEEQKLLSHISNQPFAQWAEGKEFYVTDNKISIILKPETLSQSLSGKSIKYLRHQASTSITGENYTTLIFQNANGDSLYYKINTTPQELLNRTFVDIPFTTQKSVIDEVKASLINNAYYIKTPTWNTIGSNITVGKKYVQVTISDVSSGNSIYPLKIFFKDNNNVTHWIYMTIGNEFQSTRNFDTLFSIANPRNSYPHITDENWDKITNGKVESGMTKEECRLSLGNPTTISQLPSNAGVIEIWKYNNGAQLIFEDGLLNDFKR